MRGRVLSVSGPPGSGKTTLARAAAARLGATFVDYDRYETFTRNGPEAVKDWIARGAPFHEVTAPGLAEAVQSAARQGPVVVDSPFGPADPAIGPIIRRAAWIDCPLDVALARKVRQLAGTVPPHRADAFLRWLSTYLESYAAIVRPTCLIQREQVAPLCQLSVDGRTPFDGLLPILVQFFADDLGEAIDP